MGAIFGLLGIVWVVDLSETNPGPPRFSWINVTPPNSSARVFVSHTCFFCRARAKFCLKLEAKYQPAHGLDPVLGLEGSDYRVDAFFPGTPASAVRIGRAETAYRGSR